MTRAWALWACAALLLSSAAGAQPAEELAFWDSVQASNRAQEYLAYLNAFPGGTFAPLARRRLGELGMPGQPAAIQPAPAQPVPAQAWVRPSRPMVQLVDGVTLDMDATALRTGSNLRVAVVPAGTPDEVADPTAFLADSVPVGPMRLRLTVPAGPPGQDEVRLYYIPRFASTYAVAARAPVTVGPGVPGAALARDLVREAQRLGPVRFEAVHRDRPLLVQAAFLRVRPRTEWNLRWFGGMVQQVPRQAVVISIGLPGAAPDAQGSLGEAVCALAADTPVLDRVAALQTGDPVLVRGVPTVWDDTTDVLVIERCALMEYGGRN